MSEKILNTRIQQKSDILANWTSAGNNNFIPKKGEIIHFSDLNLIKVGDGVNNINQLVYIGNDTYEIEDNKVTSISSSSTDEQYPTAKCMYTLIGDIESSLDAINSALGGLL